MKLPFTGASYHTEKKPAPGVPTRLTRPWPQTVSPSTETKEGLLTSNNKDAENELSTQSALARKYVSTLTEVVSVSSVAPATSVKLMLSDEICHWIEPVVPKARMETVPETQTFGSVMATTLAALGLSEISKFRVLLAVHPLAGSVTVRVSALVPLAVAVNPGSSMVPSLSSPAGDQE